MTESLLRRYFIAVAGNIGAGKTTLATRLASQLGWKCYLEPVIDNPYLPDFYADMSRWSFHLQVYFLSKRFQNQIDIEQDESSCVQDRTIYEDARIFAQTLRKRGFMSDRDWENYQALFASMAGQLKRPDLVIYLKSDVESLVKRIAQRGREFEKSIDTDYLGDLNQAYDQWCAGREDKLLVATIDTTSGADEEEVFSEALRLLKTKLQIELPFKHV
ncbi:MAG: deoxynucleoside kinase [Calditrichaeota bacterium]|nr:deoxynucleoside kinase [Calditrichota bacterium]MCB9368272.1 deoxynucleoside kinase [Calditrichota bacterium]